MRGKFDTFSYLLLMPHMKRTLHYSTDMRPGVKSPKILKSNKNNILPSLPGSISPSMAKSPQLINSKVRSPRNKRAANSQAEPLKLEASQFQFPKPEEYKSRPLDLKLPSSYSSEFLINPTKPAEIQVSEFKRVENSPIPSKSPEIPEKKPIVISDEIDEDSLVETKDDEIRSLKGIISEQTKSYQKLEDLYYSDTNELKRELEKLRQVRKKIESENSGLKNKVENLTKNLEENEKKGSGKVNEAEEKIYSMQAELKDKNSELFQISEILRKMQIEKKNKDEGLKELHRKLAISSESLRIVENDLNYNKRELKIVNDSLILEKEKSKQLLQQLTEYSSLKERCEIQEEAIKSLQKSSDFTLLNYNTLKSKYITLKENYMEKESQIKNFQEKSSEPSSAILPSNKQKLRRTMTLSTLSSNSDSQQRENFQRLISKIMNLEEELQTEKFENEKRKKDLEYCKKQLSEKGEIFETMKKTMTDEAQKKAKEARDAVVARIKEICGKLEWYLRTLSEKFMCQHCKVNNCASLTSVACGHLYCKSCAIFADLCPCCSVKSKTMKIKVFKETCYSNDRMNEILSEILLLINYQV